MNVPGSLDHPSALPVEGYILQAGGYIHLWSKKRVPSDTTITELWHGGDGEVGCDETNRERVETGTEKIDLDK